MKNIKTLLVLFLSACSLMTQAQSIQVLDEDQQTIPFAHIKYEEDGQKKSVLTDEEGNAHFEFTAPTHITVFILGYSKLDTLISPEQTILLQLTPDVQVLNEVVVTAQFAPNSPEKAVHQIKVIDRKRIEEQGAVNLKDLLSNETNIRIEQDNILGSGMSLQGVSGQNVKILIDGVPVIGRLDGNIDLSQINLNNIERVEIIEGPLAVNFGSNALAGTINLITKKSQEDTFNTNLTSYYESVGQYNLEVGSGLKIKKDYLNVNLGRNYFDGWSDSTFERSEQWKPKEQRYANAQYVIKSQNTTYRYSTQFFFEKIKNLGEPRYIGSEINAFDNYYRTTRYDNTLQVDHYFKSKSSLNITTAYNFYDRKKNSYFKDLITLNDNLTTNSGDQDTTKYDLFLSRGTYNFGKDSSKIHTQVGYDINLERGWGRRIGTTGEEFIGDYAVFSSTELGLVKGLVVRPGVRFSYNTAYGAPITPSVNLKYQLKASTFRASYARGFRAPSVKDLYFNFVDSNHDIHGNEDLKAETSNNFQLAWTWEKKVKNNTQLRTTISSYYNDITNLITLTQSTENNTYYQYTNIGEYTTFGSQLNVQALFSHLKITAGYTLNAQNDDLSAESSEVPDFVYSSEIRNNYMYDFYKQKITISLFYKYSGKRINYFEDENGDIVQGFVAAYNTMDFTCSKKLLKQDKLKITLGVKNLFDVTNIRSSGARGAHSSDSGSRAQSWGRSFFTRLSLQL